MRLEPGQSAILRDSDKIETLDGELYEIKPMSNELRLQNKYFMTYIESRNPLTPEQYRIAKESYEAGFRDYRKFFNELNINK